MKKIKDISLKNNEALYVGDGVHGNPMEKFQGKDGPDYNFGKKKNKNIRPIKPEDFISL